jgi:hypothetical protein
MEGVIHTLKWVDILTRNFVKFTVVNAWPQRAVSLTHKKELASRAPCGLGEPNQPPMRL